MIPPARRRAAAGIELEGNRGFRWDGRDYEIECVVVGGRGRPLQLRGAVSDVDARRLAGLVLEVGGTGGPVERGVVVRR